MVSLGLKALQKLQKLDPKNVVNLYNLGWICELGENWTFAVHYYKESLKLDENFTPSLMRLSRIYKEAGHEAEYEIYHEKYLNSLKAKHPKP